MSLSSMSLQKKLTLPVLGGLVVGLGLFSLVGIQAVNITTSRILDERLSRARIAAELLDENLGHLLFHVANSASMISDIGSRTGFNPVADSLSGVLADVAIPTLDIILADKNGKVVQSASNAPGAVGMDLSQFPEAARSLQSRSALVSNALLDWQGKQVVLVTSPVVDAKGAKTGTLVAVIDIGNTTLRSFSQAMRIGDSGYTEVVDGNGVVLVRTQPASPPRASERSDHPGRFAELIKEGNAAVRTCHRCHEDEEKAERKRDVLAFAPLSAATWGIALRQSEEEALAPTNQLERRLLIIGATVLIVIFLLVWVIMQSVVRPIKALTAATQRVAAGDFRARVPGKGRDEIGRLGTAFHAMTDELERSRGEILTRNRELSVLNSIATTVNQSLELELILGNALERVLEVTGAANGCVSLVSRETGKLVVKTRIGRQDLFCCQETASPATNCACYQVLRSGQIVAVNHPAQCLTLGTPAKSDGPGCFVAVPLKSRARTLGVMNVCCPQPDRFTENELKLLESIGYYIGLAIENSVLYEEARQKEELRGQLLSRVIGAQEEERKRIARELHDEHGQVLTGLIMNLERMENMIAPNQTQLKTRLENARAALVKSLDNIRLLTAGLRPSDLDDLGLVTAITAYAEERLGSQGITLKFAATGFEGGLPPAIETELFRILQEAINNVIRHAQARHVSINLTSRDGKVRAVVEDDGQGFEPNLSDRSGEGSFGLLGIRERTELLGGTFNIRSRPGRGTRLTIDIPVPESAYAGQRTLGRTTGRE